MFDLQTVLRAHNGEVYTDTGLRLLLASIKEKNHLADTCRECGVMGLHHKMSCDTRKPWTVDTLLRAAFEHNWVAELPAYMFKIQA